MPFFLVGWFTVELQYPATVDGARYEPYTYFDNIVVAEAVPETTVNRNAASLTTVEGTTTLSGTNTRAYTAIRGGETLYSIKDNFGYEYAALATVKGLALDSTSTEITVAAYVTTCEGEKLYGRSATIVYNGTLNSDGYPAFSIK